MDAIGPLQALELLRDLGRTREVSKGGSLAMEGDEANGFWWVERGAVRIHQISPQGRDLELGRFRSGEVVAAALAFADIPFPHFLEAVEDSLLVWFPRAAAFERITRVPELSAYFLRLLAGKCRALQGRLQSQGLRSLRERLIEHLSGKVCDAPEERFVLEGSKKELAKELGTTPESLSRALRALQEEGVLKVEGRTFRLRRPVG